MSYEWHANYDLSDPWHEMVNEIRQELEQRDRKPRDDIVSGEIAKRLSACHGPFSGVDDLYTRLHWLAQSVSNSTWNTQAKGAYAGVLLSGQYDDYVRTQVSIWESLGLCTPRLAECDLVHLPEHSFFLYVPFVLASPYISQDDQPFYVHENPLRQEHAIKVPMISPTGWKGAFRAALRWVKACSDDDARVIRLLGNPKGQETDFQQGRIRFYPSFLSKLSVGVINPHSRESGAGTLPIHIEQAPQGARGVFALLYTPVIPEDPKSAPPTWEDVAKDIELAGEATYALLAELGFGAKTANGMGRAQNGISGAYLLIHRWIESCPPLPPPPRDRQPPKAFRPTSAEFLDQDGHWPYYETDQAIEAHITGNNARKRYRKERIAYREWLKAREPWLAWEQEAARLREQVRKTMMRIELSRLGDLKDLQKKVRGGEHG